MGRRGCLGVGQFMAQIKCHCRFLMNMSTIIKIEEGNTTVETQLDQGPHKHVKVVTSRPSDFYNIFSRKDIIKPT